MAWKNHQDGRGCSMWRTPHGGVVFADFARELERDLAQRTADFGNAIAERDVARWEIIEGLKEMYTTAGLRRELLRRGWWDWYKEVKP